jgi:aminoglycoside phosphotransferase (APT) family kinase protein
VDFSSLTPLAGGWSGRTFVAEVAGERAVVRVYPPGQGSLLAPEVDAAVLRLVRGLVPVPEVLEVRRADETADAPGLLVTSWVTGVRGDLLLPDLDDDAARVVGAQLGEVAADLAGMPQPRPGPFLDADLTIGSFGGDGLPEYVAAHEAGFSHWDEAERAGLAEVAVAAQDLLDTVGRCSLVHSDLNPKNVLVDPERLVVTGVVDWEFAHAGHPCTDLGNLLRFERPPAHAAYAGAVLGAWAARRRTDPDEALALARAADLWALVDLAARAPDNPVARRAHDRLRQIARTRDPGASS